MKRILTFALALLLVFPLCLNSVKAAEIIPDQTNASLTIRSKSASLRAGSQLGELVINYSITSTGTADSLGVEFIKMYLLDGTYVTTIWGTTANGMISSGCANLGTVSFFGEVGRSYYAEVKVFARIGSEYDSRIITTASAVIPSTPPST